MDPLDTLETTRRKSGHRWLDFIVASSAIVIAVVSLIIALRQSQIMEKQLAASTWPYLQYDKSNGADDHVTKIISLQLRNAGIGPARLHDISLRYNGQPITSPKQLIDVCCSDLVAAHDHPKWSTSTTSDRVLTPNETVSFFC